MTPEDIARHIVRCVSFNHKLICGSNMLYTVIVLHDSHALHVIFCILGAQAWSHLATVARKGAWSNCHGTAMWIQCSGFLKMCAAEAFCTRKSIYVDMIPTDPIGSNSHRASVVQEHLTQFPLVLSPRRFGRAIAWSIGQGSFVPTNHAAGPSNSSFPVPFQFLSSSFPVPFQFLSLHKIHILTFPYLSTIFHPEMAISFLLRVSRCLGEGSSHHFKSW